MTLEAIEADAQAQALTILGHCPILPVDGLGTGTIVLLGPAEPGFWARVQTASEFSDGKADPLDRWSLRIVSALAREHDATPLFPFGNPSRPFISWALRSKRAWVSPVGLLIHENAGLLVSYRGALLLSQIVDQPEAAPTPCASCKNRPCVTACPVHALTEDGYDLTGCHEYLDRPVGATCMNGGCTVRRSCPVSQGYPRSRSQSAFHMAAFHPPKTDQ
ncbi:MAG: ferredoxin [Silicimonas sp.]|nr:ferredoxin [Silicimonas sp.]